MPRKFHNESPEQRLERQREYKRAWYARNREQADAASALWERNNRERRSENQRRRRAEKGEKFSYDLKTRYGVTVNQYRAMIARQGGGCAVCGVETSSAGRRLVVDHEHDTGRVRGVLCHRCNSGIGMLGDTEQGVAKAVAYLAGPAANIGTSAGLLF
jgi:hypothetical protein